MDTFDPFDFVLLYVYYEVVVMVVTLLTRERWPRIAVDRFDVDAPAGPLVAIEGRSTEFRHMLHELRGGDREMLELTVTKDWVTLRTTEPPCDHRLSLPVPRISTVDCNESPRFKQFAGLAAFAGGAAVWAAVFGLTPSRIGATLVGIGLNGALLALDRSAALLYLGEGSEKGIGAVLLPGALPRSVVVERMRAARQRLVEETARSAAPQLHPNATNGQRSA